MKFIGYPRIHSKPGWLMVAMLYFSLIGLFIIADSTLRSLIPRKEYHGNDNYTYMFGFVRSAIYTLKNSCLEQIGLFGITMMAILSGFGSVSAIYAVFFDPARKSRKLRESDTQQFVVSLKSADEMLAEKYLQLNALLGLGGTGTNMSLSEAELKSYLRNHSDNDTKKENRGIFSSVMSGLGRGGKAHKISSLRQEIQGLELVRKSVDQDLRTCNKRIQQQRYERTTVGWISKQMYGVFSLYCIYRLLSVIVGRRSLTGKLTGVEDRRGSNDLVTSILAIWLKYWDPELDIESWQGICGFLVSGVIFLCSLSSAVTTAKLFRKLTNVSEVSTSLFYLISAELFGSYMIATSMMLRSNLPENISSAVTKALGVPFDTVFADRWFDLIYTLASVFTGVALYVAHILTPDTDDMLDLEAGIPKNA
ncbi:hypothetical protein CANCADRAFT_32281 [Tortispora caseinolytica NRRL Y-17796]|uniref:Abscisic acid G-protein coupled receptor-like domain-containing protein n=1 Tax=Tortispora caseinolytica NRRL Y-17796 TaxID=767744 RepID=A0A1E4TAN3_9ASCO|nr:hypothetical protein CANCADRAFT_32281 [Tortispora caseinolytica NRRL Y-17796]